MFNGDRSSFHGMLHDDSGTRRASRYAAAARAVSLLSLGLGVAVFLLSTFYLYSLTEMTGQILGAVLVLSGGVGYAGGRKRNQSLVNLQLVASLVGVLLAFNLMTETVRSTQVDCAMAELQLRGQALQRGLASVQQHDALHAVVSRLGEMEEQLTMVQQGAAQHMELRQEQEKLRLNDLAYIRAKVDMLRRHAEAMLDSVLKNGSITAETVGALTEEEKAVLRKRMDIADQVLDRISKHHASKDEEISHQEYEALLAALTDANAAPVQAAASAELQQAAQELPNMQAALTRSKADTYDTLLVGTAPKALQRIKAVRQQRRERFDADFAQHLSKQEARGADYLLDLPEHCVKETAAERVLVASGLASIAVQLAAAYAALSLSFRLPVKAE
ncbi:hypothetical protein D9Q98_003468 [Chlorella vulgaris]|uniref:Uncharacterized protein n=1 Tax=Chlorella vulgaris TaxID=3077 RepID=A0A9D4TT51_CHLVU|nr:hypothetical protein D9Q98_003468 [Chlorella vulgaris]